MWGWIVGLGALVAVGIVAPDDEDASNSTTTILDTETSAARAETQSSEITVSTEQAPGSTMPASTAPVAGQPSTTNPSAPPTINAEALATLTELGAMLEGLVVAEPDATRPPYERDDYDREGWGDFDGDCISTRHELLIAESLEPPVMDPSGCFVEAGRWVDPYTGTQYTLADQVTVDHVVALAEAHRAGAWRWDLDSRYRFTNDEHPGQLVLVGADVNQAKADHRPDEWLPPDPAAHCQYASDWITTKARYQLTVTASEHAALTAVLESCSDASALRPLVDTPAPVVVITVPTTTTTTTIAPSAGPGEVTLLSCRRREEAVLIGNTGGEPISLSGYVLHDEGDKHSVSLGQFGDLEPGQQLTLLSGPDATAGPGQVVWTAQNVWNNDGDTATLVAPDESQQTAGC